MTPATAPLENDDLLSEILLRLPPQPSSLPRASVVCKRWLSLVSSPGFVHRFRFRHHRNPPVLGLLRQVAEGLHFQPTMEAPDHVPRGRFSLQFDGCTLLGCRHGLVLVLDASWDQVLVWDPVTGDQHRAATPPGFDMDEVPIDGAVLRDAGDHFQVVLLGYAQELNPRVVVCFYSSETGVWSNLIETPVAEDAIANDVMPAVLVRDSLYWLLNGAGESSVALEFDLNRKSLAVIQVPTDMFTEDLMVMRAEGGGLGLLSMSEYNAQLWKRNIDGDGVSSWVLGRTIELDRLLTLDSKRVMKYVRMIAYAEENNVAFLRTIAGIFMVQLESLKFNKLLENNNNYVVSYPLESVYAADNSMSSNCDYNKTTLIFNN